MKYYLLCLLPFLAGCFGSDAAKVVDAQEAAAAKVKPVFNVPSLLFSDIRAIKKELGKSEDTFKPTPLQVKMNIPGDVEFVRDTLSLEISYDLKTHKPVNFNLSYPHAVKDVDALLRTGGLDAQGVQYKLRPMPVIMAPEWIASVNIIPIKQQ